ncbi:hypothetical protein GY21_20645 [Cryobacterium roopkundense]|uniref:Uncharacterized protein n=1 Tax=Cryobacterium roopkundense TaxID=1001240 RepID=A0A099J2B9_9MICO|nr:hypothetical protein [Cryobacterium roopkundense]KGJ71662.1 hypothetical protein GY21_20645 [Cryobacterium roopkundense]MBB5639961.1 hypothetical protein [Cryobacterium roopkundense]
MSDAQHVSGPDGTNHPALPDQSERAILPPDPAAEHAEHQRESETRLRVLRGKADLAHSEVEVINALRIDPEQLEDMLTNATPTEAERIRIAERRITLRVAEARAIADAAEAEYEQAALQTFDEDML